MTRMPFYDFGARSGYKLGDRRLVDGTVMMLTDPFHDIHPAFSTPTSDRAWSAVHQSYSALNSR